MQILIHILGLETPELANLQRFAVINSIRIKRICKFFYLLDMRHTTLNSAVVQDIVLHNDLNFKFNIMAIYLNNSYFTVDTFRALFFGAPADLNLNIQKINSFQARVSSYISVDLIGRHANILLLLDLIKKKHTH